ncbi:MAG: substrate-binding domain-containing protein [Cyanobacteria bacterium P01_B01_bin.77]
MQKSSNKVPLIIALVGFGIIAGVFGVVAWLIDGGQVAESTGRSNNVIAGQPPVSAAVPEEGTLSTVQNVPKGLFNYGGSTTWIPIHEPTQTVIVSAFPEFQLRYMLPSGDAPGSGTGIQMLLEGQLSFSESSRPLEPAEYEAAQQRGFSLEQIPAAIDAIVLAVHPNLGMEGLSVDQIKAIYKGEVTNWSELGGPDLPISAYSRSPEAAGTAKFFLEDVLDTNTYGENVVFVENTTTGLRQVLGDRGGIYYASAPEIVNQCSIYAIPVALQSQPDVFVPPFADVWETGQACISQPNTINRNAFRDGSYPLTRRLFVIAKVDGADDEAAGRAYANILLSPEGQTLVEEAGFVGIR